jgi:hypothetical protein
MVYGMYIHPPSQVREHMSVPCVTFKDHKSIMPIGQCFLLIAGTEQSILIAAASQSTGPLTFGGLLADNTVLCSS